MKSWKKILKKLLLIVPILIYSCLLMLTPANMLLGHDTRLMAALVLQKRTLMHLKRQIQVLMRLCKPLLKMKQKDKCHEIIKDLF
ncbi:MAG TPA: hypothetical protein VK588_08050 [Chitinophagaceae bacterium]|nr:hypothetical protein [Chitinophagaceae bacterium]